MKKSIANVLRLIANFELKLQSLAEDNLGPFNWLKEIQNQITGIITKDKLGLGAEINATVQAARYSGTRAPEQGSAWSSQDEDGYLGARTKAALNVLQRHLQSKDVLIDQGADLLNKLNQLQLNPRTY